MITYFVYIIYSRGYDIYYIGQTHNFEQRLLYHITGKVRSTKPYSPWDVVCLIEKPNRSEAMALERKLKNINRNRLLQFIEKYN